MNYSCSVRIRNGQPLAVQFVLEPWGEIYTMPTGAVFLVIASALRMGELEVDCTQDSITVYGWPGSTVRLFHDDTELGSGSGMRSEVPNTPL